MKKISGKQRWSLFLFTSVILCFHTNAQQGVNWPAIDSEVNASMEEGKIPGLSLVVIRSGETAIRNYGYAQADKRVRITEHTLMELGSCTKSFTALAISLLESEGKLSLDDTLTYFLPWFHMFYQGKEALLRIRELLYHTSGIPWNDLSSVSSGNADSALETAVRAVSGSELENAPGTNYAYSSVNYDILGLIIAKVSGVSYEEYIETRILKPLGLENTKVGYITPISGMAEGHKMGFFKAQRYEAPVFRGNTPAGYIVSNAADMQKWLLYQLGLVSPPFPFDSLIPLTHHRDETVAPHGLFSYARGWDVSLAGDGTISHTGLNPAYSSMISFNVKEETGIVILTNCNSNATSVLGDHLMKLLLGGRIKRDIDPDGGPDKAFSVIDVLLCIYILAILVTITVMLKKIIRGRLPWTRISADQSRMLALFCLLSSVFLTGLYLFPMAVAGFNWAVALVWMPVSFKYFVGFTVVAVVLSLVALVIRAVYFATRSFRQSIPVLALVSVISGLANIAVILLVSSALHSELSLGYLIFYYMLVFFVYITGRNYVQTNMVKGTRAMTFEFRMKIVDRLFSTSYEHFEKINRGKIYATLSDDVGTIGNSANILIGVIPNLVTVIAAMLYLTTINAWATLFIAGIILTVSTIYYIVTRRTRRYFDEARTSQGRFMELLNGLIDGYKEISLSQRRRIGYKQDISRSASEYKDKIIIAATRFVHASLIGESLLILLIGSVAIVIPQLFPDIKVYAIMGIVIIMLYLIGPVNAVIASWPSIVELQVAWRRVNAFLNDCTGALPPLAASVPGVESSIRRLQVMDVMYRHKEGAGREGFGVGPVNLDLAAGEILFIIGGNGSGKSTLAKVITGLYQADAGSITIDDKEMKGYALSEHFSAVFNPLYLFGRLYGNEHSGKEREADDYLKLLGLHDKVMIENNKYSTVDLSGGQRKRLGLLQCYLEDKPIYLFDEWAADQDPEYREFFYRRLIPDMRKRGKIVIAITHDDKYFSAADKIIRMDLGKMQVVRQVPDVRPTFNSN